VAEIEQPGRPAGEPKTRFARIRRPAVVWAVLALLVGAAIGAVVATAASSNEATAAACPAMKVASETLPSVVTILTTNGNAGGNGSGEIVRSGGYILTNDHVISGAADGGQVSVLYSDGHRSDADIVGRDPDMDLAVVKADDKAAGFPLINFASSSALRVGTPVVALGAPLGLHSTVTAGIVSALGRYVPVPAGNGQTAHLINAIQTDAAINPGNSGGALVDCSGHLVGVNTAIATVPNAAGESGGGSVGLGFAIPVDLAKPLADQLIDHGVPNHPTFGLQAYPIDSNASAPGGARSGLYVSGVDTGGPAAQAGLRVGDVITHVDGEAATSVDQLTVLTLKRDPGDRIEITYLRGGASKTTKVTLTQQ
jgi:putative serine protease PepD